MAAPAAVDRSAFMRTLPRISNRRVHAHRQGRQVSLIDEDGLTLTKIHLENRNELEL